ncbi:g13195 [Coccomyxa viridis]|uniref:G13195 protein n=1 Tax=Coccomyxa viridis TaxID=1274662 RepID=A0ABP1GC76_9CHLO
MSRWGQTKNFPRFPKSALHEFYQVHGGTTVFVIEDGPPPPASPKFTCHLTIPALSSPHGGFEQQSFTAVARAKKAAEHAAAEMALEFITACGMLPPAMPMPSSGHGLSVVHEEQRLRSLTCQLAAARSGLQEAPETGQEHALTAGSSSTECEPKAEPGTNGAARRVENLRAELVKAHALNAQLRKELRLEQQRRELAVGALVGST